MSLDALSSREPTGQKRGWRGGKHEAGSADAAETEAETRAGPPRWPRQRLGRSRRPDWRRFKPHRRRSDARGAVGEPAAMEPQEARGESLEAKTPQPRARLPPLPSSRPPARLQTRGAPPRLVHTHRARRPGADARRLAAIFAPPLAADTSRACALRVPSTARRTLALRRGGFLRDRVGPGGGHQDTSTVRLLEKSKCRQRTRGKARTKTKNQSKSSDGGLRRGSQFPLPSLGILKP